MRDAEAVFIAVGTPSRRGDGHADLSYVYAAAAEIARAHWAKYGRNYYARHDYEALPKDGAEALMAALEASFPTLPGKA